MVLRQAQTIVNIAEVRGQIAEVKTNPKVLTSAI
jgi:hypothetical protein